MKNVSKKWAYLGVFTALSLICFLIENLLPPLFIPGARIGLGNAFIMLALILYSFPEAAILLLAKCLLSAIFGGAMALLYSAAAGAASLIISFALIKYCSKIISVTAIAAVSAVAHNLTQLFVFALVIGSWDVFIYAPYLALAGVVAGVATGLIVFLIIKYFPFERRTD